MNLKLIAGFELLLCLSAFQFLPKPPNIAGKWHVENQQSSFDLSLSQTNNDVEGSHCSVEMGGNKIDCVEDNSVISLTGKWGDSSTIIITFTSQFCLKTGTARITKIDDNTLQWQIITNPQGEFYIPNQAVLTRQY